MNQEEIQQAARKEKWVPKADKVKISTTNMRIDPSMTQKEGLTKSFLTSSRTLPSSRPSFPYMQQFWFTITKIKNSNFYEFKLASKKCLVDVKVFRQALDICPKSSRKRVRCTSI
ncbi:hypothetical protein Tco_0651872 [Tanacetum coccineum]|uniref:Uncharacterized protein n=1 Tax=Tanacetum coccineum TaxID=301880 RepID=A0ABQ4WW05_9ASTR